MLQQPTAQEYRPRTIHENNRERLNILPAFPRVLIKTKHGRTDLHYSAPLLANVPSHLLTVDECQRRLPEAYLDAVELKPNWTVLAFFDIEEMSFIYTLYEIFLGTFNRRWNVDIGILDYNLVRLHKCLDKVSAMMNVKTTVVPFSFDEWSIALEFYLQIDVDLFYMKTCSFRGADLYDDLPSHPNYHEKRDLFCTDTPRANFGMLPCNRKTCLCCHPRDDLTHRQIQPAVQFSTNHIHRFLNKYEAILNCPATCDTTNIVYALTCPCGQFDFVGTTTVSFAECFIYHQQEGNRILRESLMSTVVNDRISTTPIDVEANDTMWLYQHSTQCTSAIQLFLDCHPEYWCLIPMKYDKTEKEKNILISTTTTTPSRFLSSTKNNVAMHSFIDAILNLPYGYTFSRRQIEEQIKLFEQITDSIMPFSINVALFNMAIVAVLPEHCSEILRRLIGSLFVSHTECKLNKTGHLLHNINQQFQKPLCIQTEVYNNLTHPPSYNNN